MTCVAPRLVLVHGTRFSARAWDGYGQLVPEAELVAVDLPGHGQRAGQPYTSAAAQEVVAEAVAGAGADRPVIVAGHSLGGYVGAAYAAQNPDRLDALVLIGAAADPAAHPHLTRAYTGFARLLPVVGPSRMSLLANGVMRAAGVPPQRLPDATGYEVTPAAWASVVAQARADQLAQVTCPVYLVGGQFDQLRIDTAQFARFCRDPRVHVVPRATHLAPVTHPQEVGRILRAAVLAASSG